MSLPNSYASFISGVTGAQITLPVGLYQWMVTVQSGAAYVNGTVLVAGNQIRGGGLGGFKMNGGSTITVGCTGGQTLVNWDV